jgi:hypothetical protein
MIMDHTRYERLFIRNNTDDMRTLEEVCFLIVVQRVIVSFLIPTPVLLFVNANEDGNDIIDKMGT